jgi:hypothetical protein
LKLSPSHKQRREQYKADWVVTGQVITVDSLTNGQLRRLCHPNIPQLTTMILPVRWVANCSHRLPVAQWLPGYIRTGKKLIV